MAFWANITKKLKGQVTGDDIGFYIYTFIVTGGIAALVMTFIGVVWSVLGLYGMIVAISVGLVCAVREYTNDLKNGNEEKKLRFSVRPGVDL